MRDCLIAYSRFRLWEGEWVACQDQRSLEVRDRCTLGWDRALPHLVWAQVWELLMGHYLVHSFLPLRDSSNHPGPPGPVHPDSSVCVRISARGAEWKRRLH